MELRKSSRVKVGLLAAFLFMYPLIRLQTDVREFGSRSGTAAPVNSRTMTSESYGWPWLCWHNCNCSGVLTTVWDLQPLLQNVFVLVLVGCSFGLFFAVSIEQVRFSLKEIFIVIFLVAVFLSTTQSNVLRNLPDNCEQYEFGRSPPWANFIVFFAIGAAVANMLRFLSHRWPARNAAAMTTVD